MAEVNWAGNVTYTAGHVHVPFSVDELRDLVVGAPRIRVLGSRHSFNTIGDSSALVSLRALAREVAVDRASGTVSCSPATTYSELALALRPHELALANLGSLPHISIGGAIATATHGSGDRNGNLAASVAGIELLTSSGELRCYRRGDAEFDGLVVGLGALGAVTRLTLDVEPVFQVAQRIYENLTWDALTGSFDEVFASGYSVSVFTRWDELAGQLWVKRRLDQQPQETPSELFGARAAREQLHPIPGGDPAACTDQLGLPGRWDDRLAHFRAEFTPSAGEELQSEYLLPRVHAAAAIEALRPLAPRIRPLLHIGEIRTVAADGLWMSPQYGRDTVAIHFTWLRRQTAVEALLAELEDALAPFDPRPHWGKIFLATADTIAARYERCADFAALVARLDPRGAFRNSWLERRVLGSSG